MVLVGDAAHAVSPSTGQGVSLAWEDAAVLGLQLSRSADPRTAVAAYESARRARVDRVVSGASARATRRPPDRWRAASATRCSRS